MLQPLALVMYERLLPGSQLVNRLQDLKFRVQTLGDADLLVERAVELKPMVVIADLEWTTKDVFTAIQSLREDPATRHLPVIGFCRESGPDIRARAETAGVTLQVSESAILGHLPQLLDQALQVE